MVTHVRMVIPPWVVRARNVSCLHLAVLAWHGAGGLDSESCLRDMCGARPMQMQCNRRRQGEAHHETRTGAGGGLGPVCPTTVLTAGVSKG